MQLNNDEGNIGIITEEREQENEKRRMNKIVDKLEQRISKLEKVLESHAKCIGEMREEDIKTWETTNTSGDKTIWVGKK
jgi:predicted secreted protein